MGGGAEALIRQKQDTSTFWQVAVAFGWGVSEGGSSHEA